jgi:transcriptional regulator with XRE-family HTH domain
MGAIHEDWIGEHMISRAQVRQARAILGWSVRDLAMRAFVSIAAVNLIEGADVLPSENSRQLAAVRATLEAAGIEFIDGNATARVEKEAPSANSYEHRLPIRRATGCLWARGWGRLGTLGSLWARGGGRLADLSACVTAAQIRVRS